MISDQEKLRPVRRMLTGVLAFQLVLAAFLFLSDIGRDFSLPTTAEGFNDVQYAWSKGTQCQDYLKKWVAERKLSLRVED
ncbi:MAG: hypothetical protein ACPH5G_17620, partial [Pseudooceanicola atlanticus]